MIYEVTLSQTDTDLHERIRAANGVDPCYVEILKKVQEDRLFQQQKEYKVDESGLLWSKDRLYVSEGGDIRSRVIMEFHQAPYSGHPRYQKMISAIKRDVFWPKLKAKIVMFIMKCQEFHPVKAGHQHPLGLLQLLSILEWKWEVISMDFITGIPKSKKQNDSIFVVVEKFSKVAHFIPMKSTYMKVHIVDIFLEEIFRLHRIPKAIISYRDVNFTGNFWRCLFFGLEM